MSDFSEYMKIAEMHGLYSDITAGQQRIYISSPLLCFDNIVAEYFVKQDCLHIYRHFYKIVDEYSKKPFYTFTIFYPGTYLWVCDLMADVFKDKKQYGIGLKELGVNEFEKFIMRVCEVNKRRIIHERKNKIIQDFSI